MRTHETRYLIGLRVTGRLKPKFVDSHFADTLADGQ